MLPNLNPNWLPRQRLLTGRKKEDQIHNARSNIYLSFGVNLTKIGPVDPEIIGLHKNIKRKKLAQAKHIASWAGMSSEVNKHINL